MSDKLYSFLRLLSTISDAMGIDVGRENGLDDRIFDSSWVVRVLTALGRYKNGWKWVIPVTNSFCCCNSAPQLTVSVVAGWESVECCDGSRSSFPTRRVLTMMLS